MSSQTIESTNKRKEGELESENLEAKRQKTQSQSQGQTQTLAELSEIDPDLVSLIILVVLKYI